LIYHEKIKEHANQVISLKFFIVLYQLDILIPQFINPHIDRSVYGSVTGVSLSRADGAEDS